MRLRPLKHLIQLLFPERCISCDQSSPMEHLPICFECLCKLPVTNLHLHPDNLFMERLAGRVNITNGVAFLYFEKNTVVQKLIHALKYQGQSNVGIQLGKHYGRILAQVEHYKNIDYIIPVPLDPKKIKTRGYNQSEVFGEGLSASMKTPMVNNVLYRTHTLGSQTKKSRMERVMDVSNVFQVKNISKLENKQILLIDDVMTTGATLEACYTALSVIPGIKISMATIAITEG